MGFGDYVCISEWISGCVCVLVWVWHLSLCFGMDFRLGFGLCLHFGFVFRGWVSASLWVSGWVFASCSQSVGFDLGCSYFYSFFFVFLIWVLLIFLLVFFFWFFWSFFFLFFFIGSWWVLVIVVALWLCGGFQIEQWGGTGFFFMFVFESHVSDMCLFG